MSAQHTGIHIKATDRRLGKFTVDDKILRESINSGLAARLFHGSVPIDVKRDWMSEKSTFTLWHPKFDQVEKGEQVPEYIAAVENGAITWERVPHSAPHGEALSSENLDKLLTQTPSLKNSEVPA